MFKIIFSSYLLAFCLLNLFSPLALAQIPDFEELDVNNDGLIDELEYKKFSDSQEENSNLTETEEKTSEKSSFSLSEYITLGQSFIDTANFIPPCTTLNQCGTIEPAIFNYTVTEGEDVFSVNAAIALKFLTIERRFDINDGAKRYTNFIAEPVIEANVSSAVSTSNYVRATIPFIFSFNDTATLFPADRRRYKIPGDRKASFFQQHNLIVVPKYESDQEFDTQTIGLDLLYTPTIPD